MCLEREDRSRVYRMPRLVVLRGVEIDKTSGRKAVFIDEVERHNEKGSQRAVQAAETKVGARKQSSGKQGSQHHERGPVSPLLVAGGQQSPVRCREDYTSETRNSQILARASY